MKSIREYNEALKTILCPGIEIEFVSGETITILKGYKRNIAVQHGIGTMDHVWAIDNDDTVESLLKNSMHPDIPIYEIYNYNEEKSIYTQEICKIDVRKVEKKLGIPKNSLFIKNKECKINTSIIEKLLSIPPGCLDIVDGDDV